MPWNLITEATATYYSYIMNTLNSIKLADIAAGDAVLADNTWWVAEPEWYFNISPDANFDNRLCFAAQQSLSLGFHSNALSYNLGGALGHIRGSLDAVIDNARYEACVEFQSKLVTDAHGVNRYIPAP